MGLLAAVCWGLTDFLVGMNARKVGVRCSVFVGQALGLILMSVIVVTSKDQAGRFVNASIHAWLFGILAAMCTVFGALALAKAFAIGKTSVVAPLVTTYGVFTTLFAWLAGESLSIWQLSGIAACVMGVLLVSGKSDSGGEMHKVRARPSVIFALIAALCYGLSFWVQGKYSLPALGPVTMLWLAYLVGVLFLWRELFHFMRERRTFVATTYGALCAASLCNLAGFFAFSIGATHGAVSVVTVISTLSGGIAAILGCIIYREKLSALQVVGILSVVFGAGLIHAYG
ncbi:Membrane protein [Pseudomonas reidholzensis]|uniref:Membrane protein n=2 Tax=Pseudomonas reidholzensis TaxID=1785162 RepID=A0A383RV99_9PSED|nr:Membrane protein [Pseudomonas reidholzensis]